MSIISKVSGRGIPVVGNDIDTDRIIPARFLRCVTFDGLGEVVFQDERFDQDGNSKHHNFDDEKYKGANILVVNRNFGCGSSREHAPQAIMRYGIDAIIGESFAEIFSGNCTSLGIPVFTASPDVISELQEKVMIDPAAEMELDVENSSLAFEGENIPLGMVPSARTAFLKGTWNTLDVLLKNKTDIERVYAELPYT